MTRPRLLRAAAVLLWLAALAMISVAAVGPARDAALRRWRIFRLKGFAGDLLLRGPDERERVEALLAALVPERSSQIRFRPEAWKIWVAGARDPHVVVFSSDAVGPHVERHCADLRRLERSAPRRGRVRDGRALSASLAPISPTTGSSLVKCAPDRSGPDIAREVYSIAGDTVRLVRLEKKDGTEAANPPGLERIGLVSTRDPPARAPGRRRRARACGAGDGPRGRGPGARGRSSAATGSGGSPRSRGPTCAGPTA